MVLGLRLTNSIVAYISQKLKVCDREVTRLKEKGGTCHAWSFPVPSRSSFATYPSTLMCLRLSISVVFIGDLTSSIICSAHFLPTL